MAGNTFGTLFRITTAGESHGEANVVIVDGVPSGLVLDETDIQPELNRRRPGQSELVSPRKEQDIVTILSGVFRGKTTGAPVAMIIPNIDHRSKDYTDLAKKYRPGHADFTYNQKYGFRDFRGGGRASARETVARVAAGAIAQKILSYYHIEIVSYVKQIGKYKATVNSKVTRELIEKSIIRCPDKNAEKKMIHLIKKVQEEGDSIGGCSETIIKGLPPGVGEPVFDKLKADLAKALFSLPAVQGVEFGAGFRASTMKGSEHNDSFFKDDKQIKTIQNNHGGILGGLSSGMPIVCRCTIKPTSSIMQKQKTLDTSKKTTTFQIKGRHDPCILPRFIPLADAMLSITLVDHLFRNRLAKLKE